MVSYRDQAEESVARSRNFNLIRFFSVFSVLIIVVLTVFLSWLVYWQQKKALIEYSLSVAEKYAFELGNDINTSFNKMELKVSDFLQNSDSSSYKREMDKIAEYYVHRHEDIIKLKIFNTKGRTVYSTESSNIGIINTSPYLRLALNGETASTLTRRLSPNESDITEKGKAYKIDLLEVYVPIYSYSGGKLQDQIIGAFEIYKNESPLFSLMRQEFIKVPFLLLFAMGTLYMLLQIVIRKADRIIVEQNRKIEQHNAELREAQETITTSIDKVIEHESFDVRYENKSLLKCWQHKGCEKTDCPSYKNNDLRCWQVAGTFCRGKVQGYFANKYGDCRKCDVFKYAFGNRINSIGESFNNMMTLLENKHNQLQALNERLNRLIDIDPLTQVGNRRSFQKRIENMHLLSLRYGYPYSLIICDIDDFKSYNDTYGHQKGDYALVTVSNNVHKSLRKTDELFRWGGEEFVIILPEQDLVSALKVAEHLRIAIQSLALEHKGGEFRILTMSFGVGSSNTENVKYISWESVLKEADDQLYRAKLEGKNRVYPTKGNEATGRA